VYLLTVPLTRGGFLKTCSLALFAPAIDADWLFSADATPLVPEAPTVGRPVFQLRAASVNLFRAQIGSEFHVDAAGGGSARLRLAQLLDGPSDVHLEQYILIFEGVTTPSLPEGIYKFRHAELNDFELFITVPRHDSMRACYHACVSRMVGA
jgi:hypothetical protein